MFTTAAWPTEAGAPALVTAGIRASAVHDVGDFSLDGIDFIVGSGKTTRLPDVRLRIRPLTPPDATSVNGLPTLTVERTIADLLGLGTDTSLACPPTQRRRFIVDTQGYGDWRAVELAITDATNEAAREAGAGSAATVHAQVRRAPATTGACPACSPRVRPVSGCSQSA